MEWFIYEFSPSHDDIYFCLRAAIRYGHLELIQWLFIAYNVNGRISNNSAIHYSCKYGHLEVAKWLTQHYKLTKDDILAPDNKTLKCTYDNNKIEVAQWIIETFSMSIDEIGQLLFGEC
jgi:hypothetical protein